MAEQTIDKLQIAIEAEAEKGSEGLKKFITAIEKIKGLTSDGVSGLSSIKEQFSKLNEAIKPLEDKVKPLGDMARNLKKLNNLDVSKLASQLSDISRAMEKFNSSAPIGSLSGISIPKNLGAINDVDILKAEAKTKKLQASIARSDVAIERSRQSMEKLAKANEIAAARAHLEEMQIKSLNRAMQESVQETYALKDAASGIQDAFAASNYMDPAHISEAARQYRELQQAMDAFSPAVDGVSQEVGRLNDAFAELANNAGIKLNELDSHLELQKRALSGLRESLANAVNNFGVDSPQALGIEEKILSAERAIQSMTGKTEGLYAAMQSAENAAAGMNHRFQEMSADTANVEDITGDLGQRLKELKTAYNSVGSVGKIVMDTASSSTGKAGKSAIGLGRELEEVKNIFKSMGPAARSGMGEVSSAVNRTVRETDRAAKSLGRLKTETKIKNGTGGLLGGILGSGKGLKRLLSLTAITYGVKKATDAIGGFVTKTNDYIENVNLFNASMGSLASEAGEYAAQFQTKLGFDSSEAMRYMGVIQQLATNFGMTSDRALTLSKNITGLSYDFASFYNLKPEESFNKLRSAISGEIEGVRQLGIDLSNTRLQQELYALGIDRSVSSLSQADQATLRYIALMKQVGQVSGDAARTINSPANALRALQAQLQVTARAIGSIFIPALNAIIPYVTAVVKVIGMGASAIAAFFGFKMPEIASSGFSADIGNSFGGMSEGLKEASGGLKDTEDKLDDVADSAKKADKEVRQLIGGFDELNIFSKNETDELDNLKDAGKDIGNELDGLGDGLGDVLGGIDLPSYDPFAGLEDSRVDEIVDRIIDALKRLRDTLLDLGLREVLDNFKNFWGELSKQIDQYDFATAVKNALLNGFEVAMSLINLAQRLVFPIAIALDVPGIVYEAINTISALFDMLNNAVRAVTPGLEQFVKLGLVPVAEWVGEQVRDSLRFYREELEKIGHWFTEHTDMFTNLGESAGILTNKLWLILEPILDSAWSAFKDTLSYLVDEVLHLGERIGETATHLFDAASAVLQWADDLGILGAAISGVKVFLEQLGTKVRTGIATISTVIESFISTVEGFALIIEGIFTGDLKLALEGFSQIFTTIIGNALQLIGNLFNAFLEFVDNILNEFVPNWDSAMSSWWQESVAKWFKIETWVELGKNAVDGLWRGLSNIWEKAKELGSKFLKGFKDVLGIHSPSTEMEDAGYNMDAGLAQGVNGNIGMVEESVTSLANSILNILNDLFQISDESSVFFTLGVQFMQNLSTGITDNTNLPIEALTTASTSIQDTFKEAFEITDISGLFITFGLYFMQGLAKGIVDNAELVLNELQALGEQVNEEYEGYIEEFKGRVTEDFQEIYSSYSDIMHNLQSATKKTMDSMRSSVRSAVSSMSNAISQLISDIRKAIRELEKLERKKSSSSVRRSRSSSRDDDDDYSSRRAEPVALASGGVISEPTYALVGEYQGARSNPEIVAPQSTIEASVVAANGQLVQAMYQMTQMMVAAFSQGQSVSVQIDGREVGKASAEYMREEERRTGRNPGRL